MKIGLSLMKYVFAPLTKSVLIPLKLTAVASAADTGIHKKVLGNGIYGSGTTILIISNKEI